MFAEKVMHQVGKTFGLRAPKGQFGIEIETEGRGLLPGNVTGFFEGKPDGSLRNGMEYVSKPLLLAQVEPSVIQLRDMLTGLGARFEPTYRASTHIHMNFADKTFRDVLGMIVVWMLAEPLVFKQMPPGRDGSLFCVSSYDSPMAAWIDRFCENIASGWEMSGYHGRGKYSALNLNRLGGEEGLGTLEFRVFPTSMDGPEIAKWCTWLQNMYGLVVKAEDNSFLRLVRWAEQNPIAFCMEVFGRLPCDVNEAGPYVDFGAREAYEVARIVSEHLRKPAKKKKEADTAEPVAGFQ